jgi:hypothetical protein
MDRPPLSDAALFGGFFHVNGGSTHGDVRGAQLLERLWAI